MAKGPEKFEPHTIASYVQVATELERLASALRAAVTLLEIDPPIDVVQVRFEDSLERGRSGMKTWVNEAVRCADEARLEVSKNQAKNGRVRKIGHVPDPKSK